MIMIRILLHANKKKPLEVNLRASIVIGGSIMGACVCCVCAFYYNRF